MFEALSDRLGGVFDKLTGRGALSEKDVRAAMREVRVALLEADVALPVVKDFIAKVQTEAVGDKVLRSVTPGQQVIKIVHDGLIEMLGGGEETQPINLHAAPPVAILMTGLQGSGKTTTAAKIALRLKKRENKKVLLASLDTRRPAAMQQLEQLSKQADVGFLPIIEGQTATDIAARAMNAARLGGYDVVILDTAGRTSIDEELMNEASAIADIAKPAETLLVADALTGQDAVETAQRFHERLPLTGLVLTRMDGDARGGAALSMRAVTGLPVKLLGVSEKLDGLDNFDAKRIAGRILGQGDVVSLVEKAAETLDAEKAERMAAKMKKGEFDLDDLAEQLQQLQKMGGMQSILGMLPGMGKIKKQMAGMDMDDRVFKQQEAIISSMTRLERAKPAIIKASRKKRIAAGSGTGVPQVNQLLKMHKQMAGMMKKMGRGGRKGMMNALGGMGGGMPPGMGGMGMPPGGMDPNALKDLGGGGLPGLPGPTGGLPGLPKKK
ncbi:MAG: signal recognition particle protein [Robiginitomaculum sp.]|nr:signal recognition particle protein [Robiginitomaculum sp.]